MSKYRRFHSLVMFLVVTVGPGVVELGAEDWFNFEMDGSLDGVGPYMDVALDTVTGAPFISFYEEDGGNLWMARFVNSGGNCGNDNRWSCFLVDSYGDVGKHNSIAVRRAVTGTKVAISYYDATNASLKQANASCANSCTFNVVTVDAGYPPAHNYRGSYTSITYDENFVRHIAYRRTGLLGSAVMYARFVPGGGTGNCGVGSAAGFWNCTVAAEGNGYGYFNSIDTDATEMSWHAKRPSIAFYDATMGRARVAINVESGGNCGAGNSWFCRSAQIGTTIDSGRSVALTVQDSGFPELAFRNDDEQSLIYAYYVGSNGNCGFTNAPAFEWQCDVIDDEIGQLPSSGVVDWTRTVDMDRDADGRPVIVYRDVLDELGPPVLSVARPIQAMPPGTVPNCGPEDLFYTWYCEGIDFGGAHQSEASVVSIDADSRENLAIAYREIFTYAYPNHGRLKVARQLGPEIFKDGFEKGNLTAWSNH